MTPAPRFDYQAAATPGGIYQGLGALAGAATEAHAIRQKSLRDQAIAQQQAAQKEQKMAVGLARLQADNEYRQQVLRNQEASRQAMNERHAADLRQRQQEAGAKRLGEWGGAIRDTVADIGNYFQEEQKIGIGRLKAQTQADRSAALNAESASRTAWNNKRASETGANRPLTATDLKALEAEAATLAAPLIEADIRDATAKLPVGWFSGPPKLSILDEGSIRKRRQQAALAELIRQRSGSVAAPALPPVPVPAPDDEASTMSDEQLEALLLQGN
jgi:hypothetical protein